jgi:hypothetical protein
MFQTRSQSILHEQEEHEEQTVKTTIMRKGSAVAAQTFRKQSTSALLIQHNFRQFLTTKSKRVVEKVKQKEESAVHLQGVARQFFARRELARRREEKKAGQKAWLAVRSSLGTVLQIEQKKNRTKRMTAFQRAQGGHHVARARRASVVKMPTEEDLRVQEHRAKDDDLKHLPLLQAKSLSLGGKQTNNSRVAHISIYEGDCRLVVHVFFYTGTRAQYKYIIGENDWKATGLGPVSTLVRVHPEALVRHQKK